MSERERTFMFQREGGGEPEPITINIDKTVKELLDLYLQGKNLQGSFDEYAFMVGANPLKKDKFINCQIKSLRFLRPKAVINVRVVDTKMGGRF